MKLFHQLCLTAAAISTGWAQESTEESFIPNFTVGSIYGSWTDSAAFDGGGEIGMYEFATNADLPIIMRDQLKLTAGVRYRFNSIDFDAVTIHE